MLSPKGNIYLKEILSYVKFKYDRDDIRKELENHILDKMEYYQENGYDIDTAEQLSIRDMGDAKEIGVELNKQHNAIIGWIWKITNVISYLTICIFGFFYLPLIATSFLGNPIDKIPKSDIAYTINLNEKVKIDDKVIRFTKLIYEKNGDMNIYYKTYSTCLWGWYSNDYIGEITDNMGNKYTSRSGQRNAGIIRKGVETFKEFSDDADMLIISYDMYNRKFKVEIPLKKGENNE